MKPIYSVALLATLAACGGSSISQKVVSSGGVSPSASVAIIPETSDTNIQNIEPIIDNTPDATFGSLLNEVRLDNGAGPVTHDSRLNTAAQLHAEEMLENNYFSHTGLDGSSVGTRVQNAGYNVASVGENIAAGYQTEDSVLQGWISSPSHQRNNINPGFEEFGLGYARDGNDTRWVLVLGTEKSTQN